MRILTPEQMKQTEQAADQMGVSYEALMLAAGQAAARHIGEHTSVCRSVLVLCGKGNNGGDGYVVARLLAEAGVQVRVLVAEPPKTPLAQQMHKAAKEQGIELIPADGADFAALCEHAQLIVDGILGTGFAGGLDERLSAICAAVNASKATVFALDIPTGVSAATGAAASDAIRADFTIAFDSAKPGHFAYPGREHSGQLLMTDIGVPAAVRQCISTTHHLMGPDVVRPLLKPRYTNSHKGSYGRLLNLAGSGRYPGAAALSTRAALRCGVGYVTLASTRRVCYMVNQTAPEVVLLPCPQGADGGVSARALPAILTEANRATAVVAGCGLGQGEETRQIIRELLTNCTVPLILDADGINALAGNIDILKEADCPVILTPHPAEFARLLGISVGEVLADSYTLGSRFAGETGVTLLLKGSTTLVFSPDGQVRLSCSGNPGMAKAGSGDVLSGIIGALAAQGLAPADAAACGAWIHGRAGSIAAQQFSPTAMLPTDIIGCLCEVFLELGL